MTQMQAEFNTLLDPERVDVSNCDREPIHIPGCIQPHGVLFVLQEPALMVVQVSENINQWFGLTPDRLLNRPISDLLSESETHGIRQCLAGDFEYVNPLQVEVNTPKGAIAAYSIVHRVCDNIVILEIEFGQDLKSQDNITYFDFYRQVKAPIDGLQKAATLDDLCAQLVHSVRQITGFDRVMIYRFAPAGSGEVIAEACSPDLEPFLGLNYPASDIPQQARHLYTLNPLRLVPDTQYTPVALVPTLNPITQAPIDLSWSVLRSVSPIHTEYLHNMGVGSSMSISLLREGQLWGLIACHHREPKLIPYFLRTVCEFIGQMAAFELIAKVDSQDRDYQIELNTLKTAFLKSISQQSIFQQTDVLKALTQSPTNLLNLVGATGAVIALEGEFILLGQTPNLDQLQPLLNHFTIRLQRESIVQTTSLVQEWPAAESYRDVASGMLAMMVSSAQNFYILWFRPEVEQTVTWGGNPNKPVIVEDGGELRLSPRKSFAAWQETVRCTALPWKPCEYEAAQELQSAIINVALRHAAELAKLNTELERSNIDLDSFAYVASHDLKEPLRGIHNYSSFLMEDYGDILDDEGVSKLQTLVRLTRRMEYLIDSLLNYSRLGRSELAVDTIDLNFLVQEVIDLFKMSAGDRLEAIVQPLPTIQGDRAQMSELFTNLVSNAIKYNDNEIFEIKIGSLSPDHVQRVRRERPQLNFPAAAQIFYVRDNGIGIDALNFDDIFRIFKRLHIQDDYGGGTGAGLTIAQKIVERHGGKIWVASSVGKGSTFYFALREG
jgi:two-component system, chemotaxis family, sensor kinase Cph1